LLVTGGKPPRERSVQPGDSPRSIPASDLASPRLIGVGLAGNCSGNHRNSIGGNMTTTKPPPKAGRTKDLYQFVTDQIVTAIENGAASYRMPWRTSGDFPHSPVNAVSKRPYRGINILILWATAQDKGYNSGTWATYRQWQEAGAQVRKGEKSTNIIFWKFFDTEEDTTAAGEKKAKRIPMARDYSVFNAEQVEGFRRVQEIPFSKEERIEHADEFFRSLEVEIKDGGNRAFYRHSEDAVFMPPFAAFKEPIFYYSVLSHEATHWTGAPHRLDRNMKDRFASEGYAMEELVAELGAAFLCSELGLPTDPRTDHAPYISSWLKALKNDKRAIFTAAAKAQDAVDWMTKRTGTEEAVCA
jgi:antirestriction protein ArdC